MEKKPHPKKYSFLFFTLIPFITHADMVFDVHALNLSDEQKKNLNLDELGRIDTPVPGRYNVLIKLNNEIVTRQEIDFVTCDDKLCPTLTKDLLDKLGIKTSAFPALNEKNGVTNLDKIIPQSSYSLDFSTQTLVLSIPQAALLSTVRGFIAPERWDDGMTSAFINYNASGIEEKNVSHDTQNSQSSQFINLRSGANIGAWRLRNVSFYSNVKDSGSHWDSNQTWIERDIRSLRARIYAGETNTPGLVYDSFSFKGISLSSQNSMLADSQRGYAPEIRGIALTHARIEVRQNGSIIYQTFVSPGQFIINDLYPTSNAGDLDVSIIEESGEIRRFIQAFSAVPIMLRKGQLNYSLTAGQYTSYLKSSEEQVFGQFEGVYGLLDSTTLYGGLTAANKYRSVVTGAGQGLGSFGSVSLDSTFSQAEFYENETQHGQSWQFRYSKSFIETGTTMTLAGYRYSTHGYYSFSAASDNYWRQDKEDQSLSRLSPKNRLQLTFSQRLGDFGYLSFSGFQQDYWNNNSSKSRTITSSWNKSFNNINVGIGLSNTKSVGNSESVISMNVTMPLDKLLDTRKPMMLSTNYSRSSRGHSNQTATLSGSLLEENNLSYAVSQSRTAGSQQTGTANSSAISMNYLGSYGQLRGGYSYFYGERQTINWGVQGSIVAHPYGITLAQNIPENAGAALVRAPEAKSVRISNTTGVKTDWRGYTLVPALTAYRSNDIYLDTSSLASNVEVSVPVRSVIPTSGAIVLADYHVNVGKKAFLTLIYRGKPLPLGSIVNNGESISGMVNEKGQVYLSGLDGKGEITATFNSGMRCTAVYDLRNKKSDIDILIKTLTCE